MSPWPKVKLGEVLVHRKEFIIIDDLIEYKRPRVQLHAQGIVLRDEVAGALIKTKKQQVCRAGDFLVAEIDAKAGGFGIVPRSLAGSLVSSHYFLFEINESKLECRFLDYFIRTPAFREQVAAQGTTNYAAIRPSHVLGYEIPLPSLEEQQRVVARIEELAAQIQEARILRRQGIENVEMLTRSITNKKFQQLHDDSGSTPIVNVCNTITDGDHNTPPFSDEGVRFIFVGNVSSGRLHFENTKRVSDDYFKSLKSHRIPARGDILYSAVGATLGVPAIVDNDAHFCFQRHIAIIKPDRAKVDSRYMWHMLKSQTVFEKAWASTTGSAQPTIPLKAIRNISIPVPTIREQCRIVSELDALQSQVDALKRQQAESAAELDALLPAILDRAFSGQLVSQESAIVRASPRPVVDASKYFIQLIPALLREINRPITLNQLNATVALLFLPNQLNPLVETAVGKQAADHFKTFSQPNENGVFKAALDLLIKTGAVVSSQPNAGDSAILRLGSKRPPPITVAEIATDARYLAAIIDLIPVSESAPATESRTHKRSLKVQSPAIHV